MTAQALYNRWEDRRDSTTPPAGAPRWALLYNECRLHWLKDRAAAKPTTYIDRLLAPFLREFSREAITDKVLTLPVEENPFDGYVRVVLATFRYTEGADIAWLRDKPATPIVDDRLGVLLANPNERPDDHFPGYQVLGNQLKMYCDSVPYKLLVHHLTLPEPVQLATPEQRNTPVAEGDDAINEIFDRVLARLTQPPGTSAYPALVAREIPANEANL